MRHLASWSALLAAFSCSLTVNAAPSQRVQTTQKGDFVLIGNTLGFECAPGTPTPLVGSGASAACSASTNGVDTAPDVFWRSDAPSNGQALASTSTTAAEARSTAMLTLPAGASVTHAYLYWAATNTIPFADTEVTLSRPGAFTEAVTATSSFSPGVNNAYQSVADITALVQEHGVGAYRVEGIDVAELANVNNSNYFGGWSMVVLYSDETAPLRALAIFDGLDAVGAGTPQVATLTGFLVPSAGYTGKLGVIAYEGDNLTSGDQLFFNGGAPLGDAQNPNNNFFNGSRSSLGAPVSVVGDLPQLVGAPQSMAGIDLDVVDVTAKLSAGQTSAALQATSASDVYYLGAFITSVSTFQPDLGGASKAALDLNGGALVPGDVLRYTVDFSNTGNDAAILASFADVLPAGVTFVPDSLVITQNGSPLVVTDLADGDIGEYDELTRKVTARFGSGADGANGGTVPVGGSVSIQFDVTIDDGFTGNVANQGTVVASGQLGFPEKTFLTDGDAETAGDQATMVFVDGCGVASDCELPNRACDTSVSPHVCIGCLVDADCGEHSGSVCEASTCISGCRAGAACPENLVCTSSDSTIGSCIGCLTDSDCGTATSGKLCDDETCVDGCRGTNGNGCPENATCTSTDDTIGTCEPLEGTGGGGDGGQGPGGSTGSGGTNGTGGATETGGRTSAGGSLGGSGEDVSRGDASSDDGGCACSTTQSQSTNGVALLVAACGAAVFMSRRRERSLRAL